MRQKKAEETALDWGGTSDMMKRVKLVQLKGKRVFITGASSGIGRACAKAFALAGCEVIGVSRHIPEKTIKAANGGSVRFLTMDVTKEEEIDRVFADLPSIDIAVLAAGFGVAGAIAEMPIEMVKEQMDVNFFGVVNVCDRLLKNMHKAGGGRIVVIGSVAGRIAIPMQGYYSASKYALEAYVDALRLEEKENNIKATIVEPGDTKTGFTDHRRIYVKEGSTYAERVKAAVGKMERDERSGKSAASVSDLVLKICTVENPPSHVAVGITYQFVILLTRLLSDRTRERLIAKMYLPKR